MQERVEGAGVVDDPDSTGDCFNRLEVMAVLSVNPEISHL